MNPDVHFSMLSIHYCVFKGKSVISPHIYKDLHTVPLTSIALSVPLGSTGEKTAYHSHMSSHTTRGCPIRDRTSSVSFPHKESSLHQSLLPHKGHQLDLFRELWGCGWGLVGEAQNVFRLTWYRLGPTAAIQMPILTSSPWDSTLKKD